MAKVRGRRESREWVRVHIQKIRPASSPATLPVQDIRSPRMNKTGYKYARIKGIGNHSRYDTPTDTVEGRNLVDTNLAK